MDLTKFLPLIDSQNIFFPQATSFEDKFEGSISRKTVERFERIVEDAMTTFRSGGMNEESEKRGIEFHKNIRATQAERNKLGLPWTYVSCWYANEHESAGMWKLYSNQSIAIQTTFGHMKRQLLPQINNLEYRSWGKVNYIDYEKKEVPDAYLASLFYKRLSFSHEEEFRIVVQDVPKTIGPSNRPGWQTETFHFNNPQIPGKFYKIDVQSFIEAVYVAPGIDKWVHELIRSVVNRYGYTMEVNQSAIDRDPIF